MARASDEQDQGTLRMLDLSDLQQAIAVLMEANCIDVAAALTSHLESIRLRQAWRELERFGDEDLLNRACDERDKARREHEAAEATLSKVREAVERYENDGPRNIGAGTAVEMIRALLDG